MTDRETLTDQSREYMKTCFAALEKNHGPHIDQISLAIALGSGCAAAVMEVALRDEDAAKALVLTTCLMVAKAGDVKVGCAEMPDVKSEEKTTHH